MLFNSANQGAANDRMVSARLFTLGLITPLLRIDKPAPLPPYCPERKTGDSNRMCDEFIHQGLTHDPPVSRRSFGLGAAATAIALHAPAASWAHFTSTSNSDASPRACSNTWPSTTPPQCGAAFAVGSAP